MGRKRRTSSCFANEEERWKQASHHADFRGRLIQSVGKDSQTGTVFARLPVDSEFPNPHFSLKEIIELVTADLVLGNGAVGTKRTWAEHLCALGSVWVLPIENKKHPQNPPKWIREYDSQRVVEPGATIRIHSRPRRYPSFENVEVVTENTEFGFVLVNKPCGCPSHATVDNGVENALSRIQGNHSYAILPQRLDTETSGLLLVATKQEFTSYYACLLEQKTLNCVGPFEKKTPTVVEKRYRCLVVLLDGEQALQKLNSIVVSRQVVTHYVDAASPAPKTFCNTIPESITKSERKKWQMCQLRITSVGSLHSVVDSRAADTLASQLWHGPTLTAGKYVVEIEVELLTGRTHQIRGQLSALAAPIVGDPLYGGADKNIVQDSSRRISNRMALQCCDLELPQPCYSTGKQKLKLEVTEKRLHFRLENAWWTTHLEAYRQRLKDGT